MGYVQYRYDVKQKTNVFFPSPSQMGNDSLAFCYLERGSACRSICMGPSVNTWFLLVISWCGPVIVNIAWQLTAWLFLSSVVGWGGGGGCTGGSSSLLIDKILCFKAQTRFIKTSSMIKNGVKRPFPHFNSFLYEIGSRFMHKTQSHSITKIINCNNESPSFTSIFYSHFCKHTLAPEVEAASLLRKCADHSIITTGDSWQQNN